MMSRISRRLILSACFFLPVSGWAGPRAEIKAAGSLLVRIERSLPSGLEQIAWSVGPEGEQLSLNSNFIDEPGAATKLGSFRAPSSPESRGRREELARIDARTATGGHSLAVAAVSESPHRIRIYLGSAEVSPTSPYGERLATLVKQAAQRTGWQAEQAVEIEAASAGHARFRGLAASPKGAKSTDKDVTCETRDGEVEACAIPGFGRAYLAVKP